MPNPHQLPIFEGAAPVGTELSVSGSSQRWTRPYRIGDTFALVVEVKVTGVEHKETKGGIVRAHKLTLQDAYELGGDRAPDLLEALHEEYVAWEDERNGRAQLPYDGDDLDGGSAAAGEGAEARADELAERRAAAGLDALDPDGTPPLMSTCLSCEGTGKAKNHRTCKACGGTGEVAAEPADVE